MNSTILSTHDLSTGYPDRTLTSGLDLVLYAGELVCLIGPNGAGKSTLLRSLAGMQPPLAGRIDLNGRRLDAYDRRDLARSLSVVLTERIEAGNLTLRGLVTLGRHPYTDWLGRLTASDHDAIEAAIAAVHAEELADRLLHTLSDGERQKGLIARALAQQPALMLLDEPTAHLDLPHRVEIMRVLRDLAHDTGCTVLLSTHDLDLALRSADRIWLMDSAGTLHTGGPEDLVLGGQFEAAFAREGVPFDAYSGSFLLAGKPRGIVRLEGDGMAAHWTARALERAGYCPARSGDVVDGPLMGSIMVSGDDLPQWRLSRGGRTESFTSLHDLIEVLRTESAVPLRAVPFEPESISAR